VVTLDAPALTIDDQSPREGIIASQDPCQPNCRESRFQLFPGPPPPSSMADIRVSGIHPASADIQPGIFPSEMTAGESSSETHKSDLSGSGKGEGLPAGRPGKEEDMAAATLYLASYGGVL
jgi:hypothetical protein